MRELEALDSRDRTDGTPRLARLRQIPRETGRFIALLAAAAPAGRYLEIGTSAGYSTLWLALACRLVGRRLTTFEVLTEKVALARRSRAGRRRRRGRACARHALDHLEANLMSRSVSTLKRKSTLRARRPSSPTGAGRYPIADNAINHEATLRPMSIVGLPASRCARGLIGSGELCARRQPPDVTLQTPWI
jgi:hypothetical protein